MERQNSDGSYCFTITLGENCFEQFQIWLDGDSSRVLHPGWEKAGKEAPVVGPTEDENSHGLNWIIDGRGELLDKWVPIDDVPASEKDSIVRTEQADDGTFWALQQVVVPTADTGVPGDCYRVRLQILGKWRSVSWTKIGEATAPAKALPPVEGTYYIAGSWSGWSLQEMTKASNSTFTFDAELSGGGGGCEFQIVRDMDWAQVFYPATPLGNGSEYIVGPEEGGHGLNWFVSGKTGSKHRITFTRKTEGGKDVKTVSWSAL
jgi:hypothetical protein